MFQLNLLKNINIFLCDLKLCHETSLCLSTLLKQQLKVNISFIDIYLSPPKT